MSIIYLCGGGGWLTHGEGARNFNIDVEKMVSFFVPFIMDSDRSDDASHFHVSNFC